MLSPFNYTKVKRIYTSKLNHFFNVLILFFWLNELMQKKIREMLVKYINYNIFF